MLLCALFFVFCLSLCPVSFFYSPSWKECRQAAFVQYLAVEMNHLQVVCGNLDCESKRDKYFQEVQPVRPNFETNWLVIRVMPADVSGSVHMLDARGAGRQATVQVRANSSRSPETTRSLIRRPDCCNSTAKHLVPLRWRCGHSRE